MPELPEVETTRRGIEPVIKNQVLAHVEVRNPNLRWPVPEEILALRNQSVKTVQRRAKYLLIELASAPWMMIHLGMSGYLRAVDQDQPLLKHDHVLWQFEHGVSVRLNDTRRFGSVLLMDDPAEHPMLLKLGPEPLSDEFDGVLLKKLSEQRAVTVKQFIMDQQVVVGVGNIYASEALFLAGISPLRAANRIALSRYERLAQTIKEVLTKAIAAGGTTLQDFKKADGQPGYFKQQLWVYGRENEPCLCCENGIKKQVIGQRASFYCVHCQH